MFSRYYIQKLEQQITKGLREGAAAVAKKAGSNKTEKVPGFRFLKRTAGFRMPSAS